MRWVLVFLLLLVGSSAMAREGRVVRVRHEPATLSWGEFSLRTQNRLRLAAEGTAVETLPVMGSAGRILNCGNAGTIDPAGTLLLQAGDAAGTIYSPVAGVDSLDLSRVSFGVFDFGATYPGTMAVDFWSENAFESFVFVVGVDVAIETDPGPGGELYTVDLTPFAIRTSNKVMVLISDASPATDHLILPAGDSSQHCYDGQSFCSVLLDNSTGKLWLYGIFDDQACPDSANGNSLLYDIVVELEVQDVEVTTDETSFGAFRARFRP